MFTCDSYVGVSCVDGSCPLANGEEYNERYCIECPYFKGCEDCALYGIEDCSLTEVGSAPGGSDR